MHQISFEELILYYQGLERHQEGTGQKLLRAESHASAVDCAALSTLSVTDVNSPILKCLGRVSYIMALNKKQAEQGQHQKSINRQKRRQPKGGNKGLEQEHARSKLLKEQW